MLLSHVECRGLRVPIVTNGVCCAKSLRLLHTERNAHGRNLELGREEGAWTQAAFLLLVLKCKFNVSHGLKNCIKLVQMLFWEMVSVTGLTLCVGTCSFKLARGLGQGLYWGAGQWGGGCGIRTWG